MYTSVFRGFQITPLLIGLVLLVGGLLKGYQLVEWMASGDRLTKQFWLLALLVDFEMLFALWLMSGQGGRLTRLFALITFSTFAGITLGHAISGASSCGCFGKVPVNPWFALVLDLTALVALFLWRPRDGVVHDSLWCTNWKLVTVVGLAVTTIPGTLLLESDAILPLVSRSSLVKRPESWLGQPCPLLKITDIGDGLSQGSWIVVVYRPGCPACHKEIRKYERLACQIAEARQVPTRIAFIRISQRAEQDDFSFSGNAPTLHGKDGDAKRVEAREWHNSLGIDRPQQVGGQRNRRLTANLENQTILKSPQHM